MKLKVKKAFKFAHQNVRVVEYEEGQEIETDDEELIAIAIGEKWASEVKEPAGKDKAADGDKE